MRRLLVACIFLVIIAVPAHSQFLTSVSGSTVTVDVGSKDGVKVGMTAFVLQEEEVSGQFMNLKMAKIEITGVKPHTSTGKIVEQNPGFKPAKGMKLQFKDKLAGKGGLLKTESESQNSTVHKSDPVDAMTLVQKIRYGDKKLAEGKYREAVRVYGILEKEAPDDSLFSDNYEKAKQGLARQEAEARRRSAKRAEVAKIRKNLDYYRLVVEKSRKKDLAKAIQFQRDICRVDKSQSAEKLLKDLEYKQAVQNTHLPSDFESDAIQDIVARFPERAAELKRQAEAHRAERIQREQKAQAEKEARIRKAIASIESTMVYIKPGSFLMGTKGWGAENDEKPRHRVTISHGFWMGRYEVTQAQWKAIMGNNPSHFKGDNFPVETVSWNDCQEFIQKLNAKTGNHFRLPTEAEWEYACRAGTDTAFHYGNSLSSDMANFDGNYPYNASKGTYREETTPVGSFKPNAWGLYDMHGNVWEWCSDWYASDYYKHSPSNDPTGPTSGNDRVLRGGSWYNDARHCRSVYRIRYNPVYRHGNIGFRLVREEK